MQTSYENRMTEAVVGQLVDAFDVANAEVISAKASGIAPFGRMLVMSVADDVLSLPTVKLADGLLTKYPGITHRDLTKVSGQYEDKDVVAVLKKGKIWVETEETVAVGDRVYVRIDGKKEVYTITLDGDLIAANVITAKVNGVTCTETYAVSHDATMAAFAVKIAAVVGVETATLEGGDNHIVTITADTKGETLTVTDAAITGGAGQAGIVVAKTVTGIAVSSRGKFRKSADGATTVLLTTASVEWLAGHASGKAPLEVLATIVEA